MLSAREYAVEYVGSLPPEDTVVVPSLVRYGASVRAAHSERPTLSIPAVAYALDAFDTVGFGDEQAREAADVRGGLLDAGEPIGAPDVLIAGTARSIGAILVTTDDRYDRVPDLEVENLDARRA